MTESIESAFSRSGGLATTAELLALGVSKDQLRWWARSGQVTAIARGVYSPTAWLRNMAGDPRRMHAIAVGAMIKRNPDLVASHESAAYLHGIDLLMPTGTMAPRVTLTRRPQEHDRGGRYRDPAGLAGWVPDHFVMADPEGNEFCVV